MRKIIVLSLLVAITAQAYVYMSPAVETFAIIPNKVIAIDAGHGGWDPGMVGGGAAVEKDINLQIAAKLQAVLEQGGAYVLMTRVSDEALGDRKGSDLRGRAAVGNGGRADIMVSIHQNSYQDGRVRGAQVFYYSGSEESKRLAECIQSEIKGFAQTENERAAKASGSYYMLKETAAPAVIVECGFLSNPGERESLADGGYQEKMAWAIYLGILKYFEAA